MTARIGIVTDHSDVASIKCVTPSAPRPFLVVVNVAVMNGYILGIGGLPEIQQVGSEKMAFVKHSKVAPSNDERLSRAEQLDALDGILPFDRR